jgi:hypothetical protein
MWDDHQLPRAHEDSMVISWGWSKSSSSLHTSKISRWGTQVPSNKQHRYGWYRQQRPFADHFPYGKPWVEHVSVCVFPLSDNSGWCPAGVLHCGTHGSKTGASRIQNATETGINPDSQGIPLKWVLLTLSSLGTPPPHPQNLSYIEYNLKQTKCSVAYILKKSPWWMSI